MNKSKKPISDNKGTNQKVSRRSFITRSGGLGLVLAAGVAPAFIREAGASKMREISFMLPWLFVGGHGFEFAARDLGWKNRGLNVSIVRGYGSGAACKTISAGKAMFGEADYGVMVNGVAKGLNNVAIGAKLQKSPIAISCRTDSGIKTVKDLEGSNILQSASSGDFIMWPGFVRAAGIDGSKVKKTIVHPSKLISSVLNKQANCMGAYYVSNGAALGFNTPTVDFLYADFGLQSFSLGLITTREMIKSDPKLVQDVVDGAMEGLKMQLLDPEKALDFMIAARPELKAKPRKLMLLQMGNTNFLSIGPAVEEHGLGWMLEKDQKDTRDVVIKYMKATNVPQTSELFTNKFAGNVKLTAAEWAKAKAMSAANDPNKS